ncbi:MAG: MarR family transcriptional regulator [Burkholderiales bacterium]|nr:MarR family transcriptional regulator [Burkholderiales bacterium]
MRTGPKVRAGRRSWVTRPYRMLPLADRPGFLIRRLHQIHVAMFTEACAPFGITPVQYSVMTALEREGELDQASLGAEVGIDRANATDVIRRLERRGVLSRRAGKPDSRMKMCSLTPAGQRLAARMRSAVERAHRRTVAALPPRERAAFLASLVRLVEANNERGRTRLRMGQVV